MVRAWLRFFRVVNLPTVPGDVLVGAAAVLAGGLERTAGMTVVVAACVASMFLYMFGIADNDIVGAKTDRARPIPEGAISLRVARLARGLCLFAALVCGAVADLPPAWWVAAFALTVAIVVYNRTKWSLLMGLCRGLNVWCGGVAIALCKFRGIPREGRFALFCASAVWTAYIAIVTGYSNGEETDPVKKRRVGFLVGAIVYLQLAALLYFRIVPFLVVGAVLLVVLRLSKRLLPEVSAS